LAGTDVKPAPLLAMLCNVLIDNIILVELDLRKSEKSLPAAKLARI
jgi:hypothetical protein